MAVYGILALAATGRSVFQIIDRFAEAPLAFSLSALSAVVYIVATIALVAPGATWYRVARLTIGFELVGVLVVGTISLVSPGLLGLHSINPFGREATVWSAYGLGSCSSRSCFRCSGCSTCVRGVPHRSRRTGRHEVLPLPR